MVITNDFWQVEELNTFLTYYSYIEQTVDVMRKHQHFVIQRVSKYWCMWKCANLTNNCSIFSTVFYTIFKITKLALKYRLFH